MSKDVTFSNKIFDVTSKEKEIINWKYQKRVELRNQYLKEIHNPNSSIEGHLFDSQLQRHYTARFSYEQLFKPTVKNFCWMLGSTVGAITLLCVVIKKDRDAKEQRYRTGQISYRDRDWKFC